MTLQTTWPQPPCRTSPCASGSTPRSTTSAPPSSRKDHKRPIKNLSRIGLPLAMAAVVAALSFVGIRRVVP
jgi:hypothetical protein